MTVQPFLIAAPKVGLERDLEPWLLPNDAFPDLEDCYLWRGRIKRRQCYQLLGRLNRQIGMTEIDGTFSFTLPNFPILPGASQFQVGSMNPQIFQDPEPTGTPDMVNLLTPGLGSGTLVRTTGVLALNTDPALADTPVFYYPGLPVMGLASLESASLANQNVDTLIAFDTRFAYLNVNSPNTFQNLSFYQGTTTPLMWTGTDYQFFWTTNYANALWATNNNPGFQDVPLASTPEAGDGIRWLDQNKSGWVNFLPPVNANGTINFLMGSLIILPYKGRLICLNTMEGTSIGAPKNFAQRARWCQNGTPFYVDVLPTQWAANGFSFSATSWCSDVTGKGGYIDAPTLEQIISAEFVYDALVVYFERSTWQLAYTGDELLPFIWVRINTELGSQSTFSIIPLDHTAIAIGNVGIHQCDSIDVKRIDQI